MKEIATSNYSFESLRRGNTIYVDKTQYVWKLVNSDDNIYFLSRPRRFGKSLLVSTLKAFFLGKRELFNGLAIERLAPEDAWQEWPVIHLDMAQASSSESHDEQKRAFANYISSVVCNMGLTPLEGELPKDMFRRLIVHLRKVTGKQVVVLIDEYDKPILDALHTDYVDKAVGMLQSFYQELKSNVDNERFVFVTGVTKFAHTSLFSGANNPTDITQRTDYATMLGYTVQELRDNFAEHIVATASALDMDAETLVEQMTEWYDGFRFTTAPDHVFNPVSVGKFFVERFFDNFWYATGTPSFLVRQMRNNPFRMDRYTTKWYDLSEYGKSEAGRLDPMELAVQTGYLTIADVRKGFGMRVRYDFPNREIRQSWYRNMLSLAYSDMDGLRDRRSDLWDSFQAGDVDTMMQQLKWMFAGVTKENIGEVNEGYYRNLLYMLFVAFGVDTNAEEQVAGGRVDIVAQAVGQAYIMELKVSRTGTETDIMKLLDEAADQALTHRYADKYRLNGNAIHVVSVVFNHKDHQLAAWREEPCDF